jgi:hypothetical protein
MQRQAASRRRKGGDRGRASAGRWRRSPKLEIGSMVGMAEESERGRLGEKGAVAGGLSSGDGRGGRIEAVLRR